MKPTVGRIVIYHPPGSAATKPSGYPAMVTQVWSDSCVNLNVQNDGSYPLRDDQLKPTSVSELAENADPNAGGWMWPPRV